MKTDQKREFTNMTVDQYRRRIQELKDREYKKTEIRQRLCIILKKHEGIIMTEVNKANKDAEEAKAEYKLAHFQYTAVEDALKEVEYEIAALKQRKDLEIKKHAQGLCKQRNYNN